MKISEKSEEMMTDTTHLDRLVDPRTVLTVLLHRRQDPLRYDLIARREVLLDLLEDEDEVLVELIHRGLKLRRRELHHLVLGQHDGVIGVVEDAIAIHVDEEEEEEKGESGAGGGCSRWC